MNLKYEEFAGRWYPYYKFTKNGIEYEIGENSFNQIYCRENGKVIFWSDKFAKKKYTRRILLEVIKTNDVFILFKSPNPGETIKQQRKEFNMNAKIIMYGDGENDDFLNGKVGVWSWFYYKSSKQLSMMAFSTSWYKTKTRVEFEDIEKAIIDLVHEFQEDLFPF